MDLIMLIVGIILGVIATTIIRKIFSAKKPATEISEYQIQSFVENMKSVGELVVFKAFTKEIVTAAHHWLGETGKKYLTWLISNMKMAMIFQFEIDFWYDLKSPDFGVTDPGDGRLIIAMPQCLYGISIKDISFYDEQEGKLLDWLLPPLLGKAFSKGFSEEDRNKLKDEAKIQASSMAVQLIKQLSSEIEKSARQTMETLAASFGAKSVLLDFSKSQLSERGVTDLTQKQPVSTDQPGRPQP